MPDDNMQEAAEHASAAAEAVANEVKDTARRVNVPGTAILVVAGALFAGGIAYDVTRRKKKDKPDTKAKKVKKSVVVEDVEVEQTDDE